jgi:peptidoglycan-N-acetylglucosamine deacetylase
MTRLTLPLLSILILGLALAACSGPQRAEDPTPTAPSAATSTPDPSPTSPAGTTPTVTTEPEATSTIPEATSTTPPTATAEPTATDEPEPTATLAPDPTATPQPQPTATTPPAPPTVEDVWTVRRFENAGQVAVLTFDAGADAGFTAQILDTLEAEGIKTSFGMTGHWAEQHPELVQRMVDEGHHLINHSWSHPSFTGNSTNSAPLPSDQRAEELRSTENLIRDLTGAELQPYFRPPYGDYDESVLIDLATNGYTVNVMWTVDTLGWNGLTAAQINQRVWDGLAPGAIILMHVGSQSQDAVALPDMIAGLRDRGYGFATVEDLVLAAGWE